MNTHPRTKNMSAATKRFLKDTGSRLPVVCGPMYPGSNPELVAAVSEAGGFGVVQPIALSHLYKHDFRAGLKLIKSLTSKPFGVNITILPKTAASAKYVKMNDEFLDIAIEEGCKWILTSLGKPDDIVKIAHQTNVKVYHDVHNAKLALRAADAGVDGLNLLNNRMGGQTGQFGACEIMKAVREAGDLTIPMICAGGIANKSNLDDMLAQGYAGVQAGTRFLATHEVSDGREASLERAKLF